MRTLLLSLLIALSAAGSESFTLPDGRTVEGWYDDSLGVVRVRGGEIVPVLPGDLVRAGAGKPAAAPAPIPAAPTKPDATTLRPASVTPAAAAGPKAMTKEEKAEAERDFAYAEAIRAAKATAAAGDKAERDAANERKGEERQRDQAERNARKFAERALQEGISVSWLMVPLSDVYTRLIVLPRTAGNNRGTMEAWAKAEAAKAKAKEFDAAAAEKRAKAQAMFSQAEMMPHTVDLSAED